MRYTSAIVLAVATLAAAQSSSTSAASSGSTSASSSGSGSCPDQESIIAACLTSTQPQVEACDANDWKCLCDNSQAVDTCYAGCPSHPDAFGQTQTTTSYCNAARAYSSSSSSGGMTATGASGASTATTAASSTSSSDSNAVQTGFAEASGSDAASASASESGNSATGNYAPAGGLLAAIFGLALI